MKSLIVFKTHSFPNVSETFIVSNIIETIKKGHIIKIIVDTINSKTNTSQQELVQNYKLMDKVSVMIHPDLKKERNIKALFLLCNPVLCYYFIRYSLYKKKKSLDYIFTLNYYLKYRKAKAFHVHFASAIEPLFELKKIGFLKSKIVVTFHGFDAHFLPTSERLDVLKNDFHNYVECVTVNSLYLKKKLLAKGFTNEKIKIIPIGIDTSFFDANGDNKKESNFFKVITVGRLTELKGQSYGINAIKLLIDKGYKIDYTLVGTGDELESLKKLVVKLNLEKFIHFYGIGSQLEIKKLLSENQLFLMTSTNDKFERSEAFGVVSLEAQAMGLPIIGFKSGGFVETIIEGETGITVNNRDYHEMANQIEFLMNNVEKRLYMGSIARQHIKEKYDISMLTTKYLDLYS
ncbi:glycosyltransferase family 4 protein [Flavobacterium faecale]|uniref:glycosyltransferase family 4 protein n=1 Tax=Flavobacterium faecale TaxID=1355330 RepID=UPI003AB0E983